MHARKLLRSKTVAEKHYNGDAQNSPTRSRSEHDKLPGAHTVDAPGLKQRTTNRQCLQAVAFCSQASNGTHARSNNAEWRQAQLSWSGGHLGRR